jgi:acyl-CoA thioester hydrolase
MSRIKHALLCFVRLILVIAAPHFAFSLASRGASGSGPASPIPAKSAPLQFPAKAGSDGPDTVATSSHAVDARKGLEANTVTLKETCAWQLTITYRGTVYPWQCDDTGHMNVMWYVGKFDEASCQVLAKLGFTRSRFAKDGIGMVAVEQHIDYKGELHAGDLVTIRSAVLELKEKSIRLTHEMRNDETGELAATTVIVAVHIDASLRKARPLPSDIRERAGLHDREKATEFVAV